MFWYECQKIILDLNAGPEVFGNIIKLELLKNISGWIFLVVFLVKMTSAACFVGSGLKLIFYRKAHLSFSFGLLFRLLALLLDTLTVENRDVSSANNSRLHWRLSDESLTYIKDTNRLKPIRPRLFGGIKSRRGGGVGWDPHLWKLSSDCQNALTFGSSNKIWYESRRCQFSIQIFWLF